MSKTFRIFLRSIDQGFLSFVRNIWLSIASILVTVLTVTVILSVFILNLSAQKAISVLVEDLTVSIYINPQADKAEVDDLQNRLGGLENVISTEYISPDKARENFIEHFKEDPDIIKGLEVIGDYQLPASLVVVVDDLDQINEVSRIAKQPAFGQVVASVSDDKADSQKIIAKAQSVQRFIIVGGSSLGLTFAIVAFLIIFNMVRTTIFSRRREINIMSLIGARLQFINGIFFVEAFLVGLFGGLLAVGLVYGGLLVSESFINAQPELASTYELLLETETIIKMVLASVAGSIFLGLVSTYLALKRYLHFF